MKIVQWIFNIAAIAALALSIGSQVGGNNQSANLGATGTRFPNGISADSTSPSSGQVRGTTFTATSILTAATRIGVGTTSPSTTGDLVVDGTGTTTLYVGSSSATKGGCIQIDDSFGSTTKMYIKNGSPFSEAGTCK